ncbi:serine/threonine-protein kinase [Nocardia tengchongensis]
MEHLRDGDPRVIGRCVVVARLGAGSGGTVFLGRSPGNRLVAVKVVHPHLSRDHDFRRRFDREVAAAKAVGGFHTAAVIDAGWTRGTAWLITEYVPAPSLEQLIRTHGPLPEESVIALGRGIAEALTAIHAAGVVHRDLKPSNVLVTADGPRIIDFGVAGMGFGGTEAATATAGIVGTPGFLAPEQALGDPAGPASDVYSLGAVLVFAATGSGPFGEGENATLLYRVAHAAPKVDGLADGALRQVVTACLTRQPHLRPTPGELLTALPDIDFQLAAPVADLVSAYQRAPGELPPAPVRSRRKLLLGTAGAVILLPGAVFGIRAAIRPGDRTAHNGPASTTTGPTSTNSARPVSIPLERAFVTKTLALSGDERRLFLTGVGAAAVIDVATNTVGRTITIAGADNSVFSPDGRRIYAFRSGVDAVIYDGSSGDRLGAIPARDTGFGFPSRDGSRLYLQSGKTLTAVDTATNTPVGQAIPVPRETAQAAVAADGKHLYAVEYSLMTDRENRLSVLDLDAATVTATIDVTGRARAVALSADGRRAAAITWNTQSLSVIDTATNTVLGAIDYGAAASDVALSPDGSRAYVSIESAATVLTLDTTTHAILSRTRVDRGPTALALTADGRHLYVACQQDTTVTVIQLD